MLSLSLRPSVRSRGVVKVELNDRNRIEVPHVHNTEYGIPQGGKTIDLYLSRGRSLRNV